MALKTFKPYTKSTRGTILTSRDEDVEKYAAKPKELVLIYPSQSTDENTNILIGKMSEVLKPRKSFSLRLSGVQN